MCSKSLIQISEQSCPVRGLVWRETTVLKAVTACDLFSSLTWASRVTSSFSCRKDFCTLPAWNAQSHTFEKAAQVRPWHVWVWGLLLVGWTVRVAAGLSQLTLSSSPLGLSLPPAVLGKAGASHMAHPGQIQTWPLSGALSRAVLPWPGRVSHQQRPWGAGTVRQGGKAGGDLLECSPVPPWHQGCSGEVRVAGKPLPCQAAPRQQPYKMCCHLEKSQCVYRVFGEFTGLLKLERSGGAGKDEKMRRITSAAGFGLCNTGNPELGSSCIWFASL